MSELLGEVLNYTPYFRGQRADLQRDSVMLEEAYRLRYQVYCLECRYLPEQNYPDGRELDSYDEYSTHYCSFDRSGSLVGYVRLVEMDDRGRFPFQDHCVIFDDAKMPPASQCGEVSRLMVRSDYRRRRGDTLAGVNETQNIVPPEGDRRSNTPQLLLSLYRQMYAYSRAHDIRYWIAAMEVPLARSLARMNFGFRQIGAQTDYYGPVAPYLADLRELEQRLAETAPGLLAWMQAPEVLNG